MPTPEKDAPNFVTGSRTERIVNTTFLVLLLIALAATIAFV